MNERAQNHLKKAKGINGPDSIDILCMKGEIKIYE